MTFEVAPVLEPEAAEAMAWRKLIAAGCRLKCRGVNLESRHDNPHELACLVWVIERLPDAVCAQLQWVQADAANSLLAVCREWRFAPLVGQILADLVADRFGYANVTVEGEDEEMKSTTIESDFNRNRPH
jgi:hypothetical protein